MKLMHTLEAFQGEFKLFFAVLGPPINASRASIDHDHTKLRCKENIIALSGALKPAP
jgi:hypothetical protein